ncbi:MAG TPA: hypothetical protein VN969_09130 [Streptosporangiaceae bacterium]|nr:hypothetical protein [Streptosporangiaceae bacterium]
MRQDLPCLDQERRPGSGQCHMMRTTFEQAHAQLAFESLYLLAQR